VATGVGFGEMGLHRRDELVLVLRSELHAAALACRADRQRGSLLGSTLVRRGSCERSWQRGALQPGFAVDEIRLAGDCASLHAADKPFSAGLGLQRRDDASDVCSGRT